MLLQYGAAEFVVKSDHFVEELRVLDVVALLVAVVRQVARDHLLFRYVFKVDEVGLVLIVLVVETACCRAAGLRKEAWLPGH